MADTNVITGQGEGAPSGLTGVADGSQSGEDQATDKPFLHTWKSKEEADKGVAKLLDQLNDTRSKADKASSRAEQLEQMVDKLTNAVTGKQEDADEAATRKQMEELATRFDDGEISGQEHVELLMNIQSQAAARGEAKAQAALDALEEFKKQNEARFAELDPTYRSNKETIDQVQSEFGVTRQQAMAIAAKMNLAPSQPNRPNVPGSTGVGIPAGGGGNSNDAIGKLVAGLAAAATGRMPSDAVVKKVMAKGAK